MFWNRRVKSESKAVLITGCDTGFGNRLAIRLNGLGYRVYATVLDPNSTGALELSEKCKLKDKMTVIQMDVTKDEDIDQCYNLLEKDLNTNSEQLWAIVNNAGRLSYGPTSFGKFEEFRKEFDVNTFGVVRVTRKFTPMIIASQGRIVIVASLAGRVALDNFGAYSMSKYAVIGYSDILRREMKKFKVKVTTVEPGLFKTAMFFAAESILERNWNETDIQIKELYGEQYYHDLMNGIQVMVKNARVNNNVDIVVNDMIDAVVSKSPNRRYSPVQSFIFGPAPHIIGMTPQFVIDMVVEMFFQIKTKPAVMIK